MTVLSLLDRRAQIARQEFLPNRSFVSFSRRGDEPDDLTPVSKCPFANQTFDTSFGSELAE